MPYILYKSFEYRRHRSEEKTWNIVFLYAELILPDNVERIKATLKKKGGVYLGLFNRKKDVLNFMINEKYYDHVKKHFLIDVKGETGFFKMYEYIRTHG